MPDGVKTIVRWHGRSKLVTFEDTRLAASVERFLAEEPRRAVFVNLDAPPGTYEVESRTTPGGCWEIRLDPERGSHVGFHNCPYRAERPRENYACIHIAGAWLAWRETADMQIPFLRRLAEAQEEGLLSDEQTTALALRHAGTEIAPYYVPSKEELGETLSLAKVLFETRGAAIPKGINNVQEAAAIIMAGREMGFDPMTAFRRFYVVDGRTQVDAQGLAAKIQQAGAELVYHCACDECADVELVRPGRAPIRLKYTMQQATTAKSTAVYRDGKKLYDKPAWANHPADMLVWKAVTRLAKRGAADLINAVDSSMVRIEDFQDATRQLAPEDVHEAVWNEQRPALADQGGGEEESNEEQEAESADAAADTQSENISSGQDADNPGPANPADAPSTSASSTPEKSPSAVETASIGSATSSNPRELTYREAMADKATNFQVLNAFQKAVKGKTLPPSPDDWTLDALVKHAGAKWPD